MTRGSRVKAIKGMRPHASLPTLDNAFDEEFTAFINQHQLPIRKVFFCFGAFEIINRPANKTTILSIAILKNSKTIIK